jgi:hypothetical protein
MAEVPYDSFLQYMKVKCIGCGLHLLIFARNNYKLTNAPRWESMRQPPRIRARSAEDYYEKAGVGKGDNKIESNPTCKLCPSVLSELLAVEA